MGELAATGSGTLGSDPYALVTGIDRLISATKAAPVPTS
jgi:hypothetical protein